MARKGTHRGRQADELLAVAIASGRTVRDAARSAGIAERTAWRRLEQKSFRRLVRKLRRQMVSEAIGLLSAGLAEAIVVARDLCLRGRSEAIKLAAAKQLMDKGLEACFLEPLESKIQRAEQKADELMQRSATQ